MSNYYTAVLHMTLEAPDPQAAGTLFEEINRDLAIKGHGATLMALYAGQPDRVNPPAYVPCCECGQIIDVNDLDENSDEDRRLLQTLLDRVHGVSDPQIVMSIHLKETRV